jgi:Tfp pilus assembly protein PilF
MNPTTSRVLSGLFAVLLAAPAVHAQLNNAAAIRGVVKDPQGQPIQGVAVELEFKGESRVKIVKKTVTDKKGGYIYSGLLAGPWEFHFSKAGLKSTTIRSDVSLGGISEIAPVTMEAGSADAVAAAGPNAVAIAPPSAPGLGADKVKALSDKYTSAMAALKAGSYPEAEGLLKELLEAAPGFAPAHQALATVYLAKGDAAAAEASYRKVIELAPEEPAAYIALSTALSTQNRSDDALKVLEEAAPRFADNSRMQFALGAAAFNAGKSDQAQAAFLKAAELDAANVEPYFYLASLALSRSDVPKAIEHLEKYVSLAPATAPNLSAAKTLLETLKKQKK